MLPCLFKRYDGPNSPPFMPVLALTMRVISSVRYDIAGSKGFLRNTRKKLDR